MSKYCTAPHVQWLRSAAQLEIVLEIISKVSMHRNIEVSINRNVEVSIDRKVEVSISRNIEVSICRTERYFVSK